jgi:signal transduction histidine kinase
MTNNSFTNNNFSASLNKINKFRWYVSRSELNVFFYLVALIDQDSRNTLKKGSFGAPGLLEIFNSVIDFNHQENYLQFLLPIINRGSSDELIELIILLSNEVDSNPPWFKPFEIDDSIQVSCDLFDKKDNETYLTPSWYKKILISKGGINDKSKILSFGSDAADYLLFCAKERNVKTLVYVDYNNKNLFLAYLRAKFLGIEIETYTHFDIYNLGAYDFEQVLITDSNFHSTSQNYLNLYQNVENVIQAKKIFLSLNGFPMSGSLKTFLDSKIDSHQFEEQITCPKGVFSSFTTSATNVFIFGPGNSENIIFYDLYPIKSNNFEELLCNSELDTLLNNKGDGFYPNLVTNVKYSDFPIIKDSRKYLAKYHITQLAQNKLISEIPNAIKLSNILTFKRGRIFGKKPKNELENANYKVILASDLHEDYSDIYVKNASGLLEGINKKVEPLTKTCVLVSLVGDLRPRIFDPINFKTKVYLSKNMVSIYPNRDLSFEYIVYLLSSPIINKQMSLLTRKSTINRISPHDLGSFNVSLAETRQEQERFVLSNKMALIEKEETRIEQLKSDLEIKVNKEDAEFEIVKHISHNLNPKLTEISSVLSSLKDFLENKNLLNKPLYPPMDDEPPELVLEALDSALGRISVMHRLIRSTRSLVVERVSIKEFIAIEPSKLIDDILPCLENISDFAKVVVESKTKKKNLLIKVHFGYVQELFENLVRNSNTHGFDFFDEHNVIKIEIDIDENNDFITFQYSNNGKPMPEELTAHSFLSYGVKEQNSPGDGLGGAFIRKVVEAHNGKFEIIKKLKGAHFELKLPLSMGE